MEDFHASPPWVRAGTYGFLSAASLPIGAICGTVLQPVDVRTTALIVAFGAGALLFAVATELYAESLRQVEKDPSSTAVKEISMSMVCAVLGAIAFTEMNKWLADDETKQHGSGHGHKARKRLPGSQEGSVGLHEAGLPGSPSPPTARSGTSTASSSGGDVALSMFLGVAMDGIPESMLIGFLTNEKAMTVAFLVSIFIANFPEAFSSAAMLSKSMSMPKIVAMWTSLALLTCFLSAFAAFLLPEDIHASEHAEIIHLFGAAVEGLAGGAMLAMVCATMLPEAYHVGGQWSGLVAVLGFIAACGIKVTFGRAPGGNEHAAHGVGDDINPVHVVSSDVGGAVTEAVSFLAREIGSMRHHDV